MTSGFNGIKKGIKETNENNTGLVHTVPEYETKD